MFSNFVFGQLNNRIDKSQRNSLLSSPFNTAKRMTKNLDVQKKVRLNYIDILDSLIRIKPADTILICENYDDICFDCPAEYVRILCDTILIELKRGSNGIYYEKNNKLLSESFIDTEANFYGDFQILKKAIQKDGSWFLKPEKYGTDHCFDGGHDFYSVLYPDKVISSLYIRCWRIDMNAH